MQAIEAKGDELFRRSNVGHDHCPDLEVPDRKALRALALDELCRDGWAGDVHSSRPARPEVTVIINAGEPDTVMDPQGVRLQDGTTRTLRCDPDLFPVVVDSLG